MIPALIGVALGLLLRFIILSIRKSRQGGGMQQKTPLPVPQPWQPPKPGAEDGSRTEKPGGKPVLKGMSGYYAGTSVELGTEPLTLGRDARASNLVLPQEAGAVSQRHCMLHYDGQRFQIEDCWSTNGTFLANGEKLQPGLQRPLAPGEVFYLGDPENGFQVDYE